MKKKLHISFLGLGILVLLLSQLITLLPAPRAAAASLSIEDYSISARKYSAYAAFHECLLQVPSGYKTQGTDLGQGKLFSGLNRPGEPTGSLVVVGMINDIGNGDGTVFCDEAAQKWYEQAGYASVDVMMKDLGFASSTATSSCGGMATQTCTSTVWTLTAAPSVLSSNHQTIAKNKKIPLSIDDPGIKYSLAAAALQSSSCGATLTSATSAGANTVALLTDSSGVITYKTIDWGTTTGPAQHANTGSAQVAAYPDPINSKPNGTVSCDNIVTYLNSSQGTSYFAAAMVAARIEQTASDFAKNACEKAGITDKKKLATCLKDFSGWAKECIKDYYTGNASSGGSSSSYSATFDVNTVASCVYGKSKSKYKNVTLEDLTGLLQAAMDGNTPTDTTATAANDDPCSVLGDVQMRWLACALLTAGAGIAQTFYSIIQSLLYSPVAETFKSINTPFKTFRLLGMALIVITGLIMIIAQATGSDLVDAYTVKKVLPKLGMALIGIALALPLLRFAVDLTNNLGFLVGDFIANVNGANNASIGASGSDGIGAGLIALVGAGGAVVAGYVYGLSVISFILIIALGLLVGVVTLAIRQLVIVVLILLAPLAIASYVLPGTDKLWKFWKTTLLTTLAMFPIIMLFIKSGVLMASIFGARGDGFSTLMAALVYFAPYFMIPFAFKMAGGLMGNVFGMLNDRMKGAYNGLRSWRQNTRKRRVADYLTEKKNGPKIFGKDIIGEGIRRAATVYEGSMSLNPERQRAYRKYRQKLVNDDAIKGVQADNGLSTGNTAATDVARTAKDGADFDRKFTDNYVAAQRAKGSTKTDDELRKEGTAKARLARSELEGSLETTMGSTRMKAAARHAYGVTDNTAFWKEDENMPDLDDFYGSYARQIDEGIISEGQAVTETGANKMRPDSTKLSSGQRLQAVQWLRENAAAYAAANPNADPGEGYVFTPAQLETVTAWASAGISADEAVLANPRAGKAVATTLDKGLRSVYEGTDLAIDEEGRKAKEKFIADRIPVLIEKSRRAGVAIDDTRARAEAEQAYKNQVGLEQIAKVAAIADGIGRGIPEVQSILSRGLLGQEVDLKTMDRDFALSIGITDEEINSGKFMTHLEIAKRATPYIQTLHKDYLSGNEELGAKASGITAEGGAASGPTPAAIGGGSS